MLTAVAQRLHESRIAVDHQSGHANLHESQGLQHQQHHVGSELQPTEPLRYGREI